jgi:hypothetical protein
MNRRVLFYCTLIASCAAFSLKKFSTRSANSRVHRGASLPTRKTVSQLQAASIAVSDIEELGKPVQYGPNLKIKGKVLTGWGVMYALVTFTLAVVVFPFMAVIALFCDLFGNRKVNSPVVVGIMRAESSYPSDGC